METLLCNNLRCLKLYFWILISTISRCDTDNDSKCSSEQLEKFILLTSLDLCTQYHGEKNLSLRKLKCSEPKARPSEGSSSRQASTEAVAVENSKLSFNIFCKQYG